MSKLGGMLGGCVRSGDTKGFALVEIIVVVGLFSLLLPLFFSQLITWRAQGARALAKSEFAALASSEHIYFAEHASYTDNLSFLNWTPNEPPRFLFGFTSDHLPETSGINDTAELAAQGHPILLPALMVDAYGVPLTVEVLPKATVSMAHFELGAAGCVEPDGVIERWVINSEGRFVILNGYRGVR
ncbi:hypothetical protein KAI87_07240 [Myxococcota bacterium]|nr:hypothetical protein [Myxococcota bacterium]